MIFYRHKLLITAIVMLVVSILFFGGCCSPKVENAILSPEAKNVQAWKVELVVDSTSAMSDPLITDLRAGLKSKFVKEEYCAPYIETVRGELRARGYHVVDGPASDGTIWLDIKGKKEQFWTVLLGAEKEWDEEREWDSRGDPTEGHLSDDKVKIQEGKFLESDEIRSVKMEFYDINGKSLGQASILGGRIYPDFIARTIDKMIREGKY
jgi:hypothetical protein